MTITAWISLVIFWGGALLLLYVYVGYGFVLGVVARLFGSEEPKSDRELGEVISVTVILTVHNAESFIQARLQNLIMQDYPSERMEIIVASDGSHDLTDALVTAAMETGRVRLIRTERGGKSSAQNAAMLIARGDVIVLTDVETHFEISAVTKMVSCFADEAIGCVTAELRFRTHTNAVSRSQVRYWLRELEIRRNESSLGILAVASGQAMAFRRCLWRELPHFAGDDCIIPLEVVRHGFRVFHCSSALAYDDMPSSSGAEFSARVRMTARNWAGIWLYRSLLNPWHNPGYAFSLWSHKVLRWSGSLALPAMLAATAAGMCSWPTQRLPAMAFIIFLSVGTIGAVSGRRVRSFPLVGAIYSFLLANVGFLVGIGKALMRRRITFY